MKCRADITDKLPTHSISQYRTRPLTGIDAIVIHHSATQTGDPWTFARHHISRGHPGIAYHEVIMPDGMRYKTNHDSTVSWHTQNFNESSIGICLVGNFSEGVPTPAQRRALADSLILYGSSYRIRPQRLYGHREQFGTQCPGNNVSMEDIRGMYRFLTLALT